MTGVAAPAADKGDVRVFNLALYSPTQTTRPHDSVDGLRLGLMFSENEYMNGLDISIWGRTYKDARGAQFAVVNSVYGDAYGFQCAFYGMNHVVGDFYGVQDASYNCVDGTMYGFQNGLFDIIAFNECQELKGCQLALVNYSRKVSGGVQLGIVNYCRTGAWVFQVGLVNIITESSVPFFPFINCNFP